MAKSIAQQNAEKFIKKFKVALDAAGDGKKAKGSAVEGLRTKHLKLVRELEQCRSFVNGAPTLVFDHNGWLVGCTEILELEQLKENDLLEVALAVKPDEELDDSVVCDDSNTILARMRGQLFFIGEQSCLIVSPLESYK